MPEDPIGSTYTTVLQEANEIIHGARQQEYGGPDESFTRIAQMWSAYTGTVITKHDVSMMMILLKASRSREGVIRSGRPQRDSLVDIAGYAGCSDLLMQ